MVRLKFRYIVGQLLDEQGGDAAAQVSEADLQSTIKEKISQLFGDCGLGFFGSTTQLKHFDSERGLFVLRAPRDSFSEVHFALTSICEVKKKPIVTRVLSVSSCNRTCREKLIQTYTTYVELDDSLLKAHKDQLWPNLLQRISAVDL